ncbi:T9SS type A sorting domain-containing protein [Aequorivita marina]|uniref:T9SS type A sorting domain-containing protein n=1 Tax=Aequorivita marina TaxID=3073654 RepID=UPI0028763160|nr:T9SS type A sorting domain-containing protein [Aequorivita sp. S2608]MDS1297472.1 T9SS type A sorting domain-containing protein [Aequorivita sp. S2608]
MKKLLLLFATCFSFFSAYAQPAGMIGETFNLKYIETDNLFLTPNGESPNLTFYQIPNSYVLDAGGIYNGMSAGANFSGNSVTFHSYSVTLHDCVEPNCYYEDLYFYEILTNQYLESKTLTYNYQERDGYKYLSLRDADYNYAYYSTKPAAVPNPLLFQTWYLYMTEFDLGDPVYYSGPNSPQFTINQDFTYTGSEGCALISGDFILGNGGEFYEFTLQSQNYQQDEDNCPPGPVDYALQDLMYQDPLLGCNFYTDNDGIVHLQYETYAGFVSHFSNQLLSVNENSLSDLVIFPNPTQNKLMIQSVIKNFDFVSIADINGRIIHSEKNMVSNLIDVSALKPGMYFITITSPEGNSTKKFIKE